MAKDGAKYLTLLGLAIFLIPIAFAATDTATTTFEITPRGECEPNTQVQRGSTIYYCGSDGWIDPSSGVECPHGVDRSKGRLECFYPTYSQTDYTPVILIILALLLIGAGVLIGVLYSKRSRKVR